MYCAKLFLMTAGMVMVLIGGGCSDSNVTTGPQYPQYPNNPVPADGAVNQPLHVTLSWQDGDANHPAQSWDVCFGIYNNPPTVASERTATSYDPGTLAAGTTYHWQVVARYSDGGMTRGPEWTFTTTP
jgi:hypothetical protein